MNLQLGQKMRDRVSGFAGIAEIKVDFLNGNSQFTITSEGTDSKSKGFDTFQLERVADVLDAIPAPTDTGIELGEKVKDIVSGVEGIATMRSTFLNGCVYYTVVPDFAKSPKDLSEFFFDWQRLKRTSAGVKAAVEKRASISPTVTGGPSYSVPARS